ncbi:MULTISPECIES: hypothetical protein [Chromohalobacter]|uniref:hypothetical protein n=1 Tax=Chromohalobacter TaxID=42054 RepID=UPI001FFD7F91|nr:MULTISPECIES: hypothetical protein [Chromohalobacter]MCT8514915.1 hypothetical protein [Chromohalobacter sp. TMW 2.2271]MDO0945917.1 hypothetical protein [Chromohalobacter salexigens]
MPARKGGSFVIKDGEPTLKHRTRPRERKPKAQPSTASANTTSPTKADTKRAAVKKESTDADA